MSLKSIDAKIRTFSTNRAKLQVLGHEIAMMIFRHAAPEAAGPDCVGSGDCTRILKLAKQMPKSWQVQLSDWCEAFSPIRFNVKNEKEGFAPEYKKLQTREEKLAWWKLEEAAQTPFYELAEPDVAAKQMTLEQLLKLVPQLASRIEKKLGEEDAMAPDALPVAREMVAALSGLRFDVRPAPANDGEEAPAAANG